MYILLFFALFIWFAFWSAQAGRSMASISEKLDNWQNKSSFMAAVPEIIIALSIGAVALWGWREVFTLNLWGSCAVYPVFCAVAYMGKQSATWGFLNHEGHTKDNNGDGVIDENDGRQSTMRKINDWIAKRFGKKLGDEAYSWVWAFTKGLITTLPLCGTGAIFQPIGREVASHAEGRLPYDPNFWMESVGDGFGYSAAAFTFICTIQYFT